MWRRNVFIRIFFIMGTSCFLRGTHAQVQFKNKSDLPVIIQRVDPPHWYQGMGSDTLQLLAYGAQLKDVSVKVLNEGCSITLNRSNSSDYVLFDLILSDTFSGMVTFDILKGKQKQRLHYEIKKKPLILPSHSEQPYTLSPSDAMYLIMPDRFRNGDTSNDIVVEMKEGVNRNDPFGRFGGDIEGIRKGLPLIKEMGFTALWLTPLWENNMHKQSYHGYACTDHYRIDPRFGDMQAYQNLCKEARSMGIKMVIDLVYNHVGDQHPLFRNPVDTSWFHHFKEQTLTNYRLATIPDPYAISSERKLMEEGWFVKVMPDLNQRNPDVAQYLIQNTLWWIAQAGLEGIRVDTYPYSYAGFLSELNRRLKRVFPHVFLFGETWEVGVPTQVVYAPNNIFSNDSLEMPHSITDFQVGFSLQKGLNEEWNWDAGLSRLYYTLAADYLYKHPEYLITFIDNHDMDRIHGHYQNTHWKTKMALGLLAMSRGIPCVFYGTEASMNKMGSHGEIRETMPGFLASDRRSIFVESQRIQNEKDWISYIQRLNLIRTQTFRSLFEKGKRFQWVPTTGVYAAGILEGKRMLVYAANQSKDTQQLDLSHLPQGSTWQRCRKWLPTEENKEPEFKNREPLWLEPFSFSVWEFQE
jgi:neopullulanase